MKLPKLSKNELRLIQCANVETRGIHFGDVWYPVGTRQYRLLKRKAK